MELRRILITICMALGCCWAGCGDDDPAGPAGDSLPVMALDVGNTWQYHLRDNEPGAPVQVLTRTIGEHREIDFEGRTVSVAVEMPSAATTGKFHPGTGRLLRNEADGLYSYGTVDGEGNVVDLHRSLVAPRDGQPGDRHDMGAGRFLVCLAADSLVHTDFGEVAADVYELVMDEGTVRVPDVFVVPGVGLTLYYNLQWTAWMVGYDFD